MTTIVYSAAVTKGAATVVKDTTVAGNLNVTGTSFIQGVSIPPISVKTVGTFPPLSKTDTRVLVDIGTSNVVSQNTWTSLPTGWTQTNSTGTANSATGFIPGTGGNQAGRIDSPDNWNLTIGNQGTIYIELDRAAISVNGAIQSTANSWWDSIGNPYANTGGNYPAAAWAFANTTANRYYALMLNFSYTQIQDFDGSNYRYATFSVLNPNYQSPNFSNTASVVYTWSANTSYIYVDNVLVSANANSAIVPVGTFKRVTIGNGPGGASAYLGGNLGPYNIKRFQISTAFCPPLAPRLLIGVTGDSYSAGDGGFAGDSGDPAIATFSGIYANNTIGISKYNVANCNPNPTSTTGFITWGGLMQAYASKQLGSRLAFFGATKSGYANYFTGYPPSSVRDNPRAGLTVYTDALNSARPAIVLELDSINNLLQASISTYQTSTDCVGDLKWRFDYMADNNPNLRAIILVEAMSVEKMPAGSLSSTGISTPANAAIVSAYFRRLNRAAFYDTRYYAGGRVPVIYVPTYERADGAYDGNLLHWGSNPNNTNIQDPGGLQGPSGSTPDIHLTVYGRMRLADIVWEALKPVAQALLTNVDAEIPFVAAYEQSAIVPNCSLGVTQVYTINNNATIAAPLNPSPIGSRLKFKIIQNATGGYTATFNSAYYRNAPSWGTGTSNKTAYAEFECIDPITNSWQYVGGSTAFA